VLQKPFTKFLLLFLFTSDQKTRPLYIFFSGEIKFSGTVAGGAPPCRSSKTPLFLKLFTSKHPSPYSKTESLVKTSKKQTYMARSTPEDPSLNIHFQMFSNSKKHTNRQVQKRSKVEE
jgi:hypothetical protein